MGTLRFQGARGSVPVSQAGFERYGGATICLTMELAPGHYLIIDAGTGIRSFQHELPDGGNLQFSVLLSHYHWDHLLGLPFFRPLFDATNTFTFYGVEREGRSVESAISGVFQPPWFPLPLQETLSTKTYVDIGDHPSLNLEGIAVSSVGLAHPQGVTAYRLETEAASVVFATDVERGDAESDEALRLFSQGATYLIHDSQYETEEYGAHQGWGHSTWRHAVAAAQEAGVEHLILVSHDPDRTDEMVDGMLEEAREVFPNTEAAYAGMAISL